MSIHPQESYWILETHHTGYAFGLNEAGLLTHTYWGRRLALPGDPTPDNIKQE